MKIISISIIVGLIILAIIGCIIMSETDEVDPLELTFFQETYEESREQFRKLAVSLKKQFNNVEISRLMVPSEVGSDLSIDTIYFPAQNETKKILIMSSGVHGIEGFTGSAVQRYFMMKVLKFETLRNMGVLLIHSINPYGFKQERRVSENNVDMNRNFDVNKTLFSRKNEGYGKIIQYLNPQKKVKVGYFRNGFFFIKSIYYILRYKMESLRQSTLQGQYEFKEGIFYGGDDFERQKGWLERLILGKTRDYEYVLVIDLHTGYGERGKLHLLPGAVQDTERKALLERMFKDFTIDWPSTKNEFIIVRGSFRDYVGNLIADDKKYIGTVFEFGTLDSHKTVGSIRSLHNIILENQGFHHGYKNDKKEKIVKKRFREMFFPSSEIWRSQIMKQVSEILPILIDRFADIDS